MTTNPEMWIAVNTIGILLIGIVGAINNWATRRKVQEVKTIVDGPLSVALATNAQLASENAVLKRAIAERTGDHGDMRAAVLAEQASDRATTISANRAEGKAVAAISTPNRLSE